MIAIPVARHSIDKKMMVYLKPRYEGLHMHMLVANGEAISFYKKCGFTKAGKTEPMWIYDGDEH